MKTLYLDIFSGISGDMFIGAMLDLGADARELENELRKLGLHEYQLHVSRQERGAIAGTKFDVNLLRQDEHRPYEAKRGHAHHRDHEHGRGQGHEEVAGYHDHLSGAEHGPHGGTLVSTATARVELSVFETNVPPRFRLYFFDSHGHEKKPLPVGAVTLETIRGRCRQVFRFKKHGAFLEATDELPEPHEFKAVLKIRRGAKTEKRATNFVEAHHHHHGHGDAPEHTRDHGRTFAEISAMIRGSRLSLWVKEKSVAVFHRIAVAEGKIHGHPPERVHFHEVGAVDSIVDIVGACVALEMLGKPRVLAGTPIEGTGTIRCAHGTFPIPAPATLEILGGRRVSIQQCEEPGELITPTGAALLAEFVERFAPLQDLSVERIGYGLGTRQNKTRPNVLRAVLGTESKVRSPMSKAGHALDWETDTVAVLETNLDDINAELLGAFVEKALGAGALDVFHTPVQMKKNRPGVLLTVLCAADEADRFCELMLRETTAFGVRRTLAERRKLRRETIRANTRYGEVIVKLGRLNGRVIQTSPEFESCRKVAKAAGVTLREVYQAAIKTVKI